MTSRVGPLTILWLISIATAADHKYDCADVMIAEKGRLEGVKDIGKIDHLSAMACIDACKKKNGCKSVLYYADHNDKRKCELLDQTKFTRKFVEDPNRDYYEIRSVKISRGTTFLKSKDETAPSPSSPCTTPITPCHNNATCQETCGYSLYSCRCLRGTKDELCSTFIGPLSDFDLYFPRGNSKDYVVQKFKDFRFTHTASKFDKIIIAFWVFPESRNGHQTLVCIVQDDKVAMRIFLTGGDSSKKYLKVKMKTTFKHSFKVDMYKWSFVRIKWYKHNGKMSVLVNSNAKNTGEDDSYNKHYDLSARALIVVGKDYEFHTDGSAGHYGFKGMISRLNVWNYDANPEKNLIESNARVAWPMFWDFYGPKVYGSVIKLPYSELSKRVHSVVPDDKINYTTHGIAPSQVKVENDHGSLKFTVTMDSVASCDSVAVFSVHLTSDVDKIPKRIKYYQSFIGNVDCYGIFGGSLDGPFKMNDTGLHPFDPTKDRLYAYTSNIGTPNTAPHIPRGSISSCHDDKFWKNFGKYEGATTVTQRTKGTSNELIINTFVKCLKGKFELKGFTFISDP